MRTIYRKTLWNTVLIILCVLALFGLVHRREPTLFRGVDNLRLHDYQESSVSANYLAENYKNKLGRLMDEQPKKERDSVNINLLTTTTSTATSRKTIIKQEEVVEAFQGQNEIPGLNPNNLNKTKKWKKSEDGFTQMLSANMPTAEEKIQKTPKMKKLYIERKKILNKYCGTKRIYTAWPEDIQLIADPKHAVALCYVQKAGSTSWIRAISLASGQPLTGDYRTKIATATAELPDSTKKQLMRNPEASRIITVRHPFSRLISGWHNKFSNKFIEEHDGKVLMLDTMPSLVPYSKRYPDENYYISFKGFMQYIIDKGLDEVDVHFKSINQLCRPCDFPYDFIVKAETGPAYGWYILDRFNGTMPNFKAHIPANVANATSEQAAEQPVSVEEAIIRLQEIEVIKVREMFKSLPRSMIMKLKALYSEDFKMFGYKFEEDTLTLKST